MILSRTEWIIDLYLEKGTKTNLFRNSLVTPDYAKFRCNKSIVKKITDKHSEMMSDSVTSDRDKTFVYTVGKKVIVDNFDTSDEICSTGIHFYLTRDAAYQHNLQPKNGDRLMYHENGELLTKCFYMNGQLHGEYLRYHKNGELLTKCFFVNGQLHGEYLRYHKNGELLTKCFFVNGQLHGEYLRYHKNGLLQAKYFYVNGLMYHENDLANDLATNQLILSVAIIVFFCMIFFVS